MVGRWVLVPEIGVRVPARQQYCDSDREGSWLKNFK